jgi:hypothetical protein
MIGAAPAPGPAEILEALPARTLRRPVRSIMLSKRATDEKAGDAIVELALGDRIEWTHREAVQLVRDLETETMPLNAWRQIVRVNK